MFISVKCNKVFRITQHGENLNTYLLRLHVSWCKDSTMAINTDWFKGLMADRRISQRELAKRLGVDHSALSLAFRGKRQMKMSEAADLARLLGVPVSEVMENAGIQAESKTVPFRGWIDSHNEFHSEDSETRIPSPTVMPVGSFAIQYRTSGTPMEHLDGWMMFVRAPREGVPPECFNKLCLVRLSEGVQMTGVVKRGYQKGRYNLVMNAAQQINDVQLDWAALITHIET